MNADLLIRKMHRAELDVLVEWAAAEGWNPGLSDAEIFWQTDPEAFIAAELAGELIGGGSIVSYGGRFGFMGFFIIHPDFRGRGLGNQLWHERLQRLIKRLNNPATIGMDGVFDMQSWYARGGFNFAHRDLRFQATGQNFDMPEGVTRLEEIPFSRVEAYDRAHFPAPRSQFLAHWIKQPGSFAMATSGDDRLTGYGVMRPCREGHKIGPLFADDEKIAHDLYRALVSKAPGSSICLDVPENNPHALALASHYQMKEVFGCAKMYYGPRPVLPDNEIFAVTTFELG